MNITLHYLFSKNEKIGSKIIRWATKHLVEAKDVPSHVALLVNERWVFESTLFTGIRVIPYKKWLEINSEVKKIKCREHREYTKLRAIYDRIKKKKYDWPGIIYFGWFLLLNKITGLPIPKVNKWQSESLYFCSEAIAEVLDMPDHGMKSPAEMMVDVAAK